MKDVDWTSLVNSNAEPVQNRGPILIHNLKRSISDLRIFNLLRCHPSSISIYATQGKYK